ncbi:GILT-like protein 1 [Neodiprion pinetum]|uniref:GILT-like protein 1 n=1 Tax=Neodiprion pinetum TaxID=441929 RepID=UPI001EDE4396|nr:GILT-like protein 1 [Neodiprion pinetum]
MSKYLVLLLITIGAVTAQQKVSVKIYYESLCEDSMAFFTKSFVPAWRDEDVQRYINLSLIPYGKSIPKSSDPNNRWDCHHGREECVGNKFQSCIIDKSSGLTVKNQVDFIDCLMSKADKSSAYMPTADTCASTVHTNAETLKNLKQCADGSQGNSIYEMNQNKTNALQNPLQSVPTIVFNDRYNKADSDTAQKSFLTVLCKYIMDSPKPKACDSVSGAPSTTAGLMSLVTAGLIYRML